MKFNQSKKKHQQQQQKRHTGRKHSLSHTKLLNTMKWRFVENSNEIRILITYRTQHISCIEFPSAGDGCEKWHFRELESERER